MKNLKIEKEFELTVSVGKNIETQIKGKGEKAISLKGFPLYFASTNQFLESFVDYETDRNGVYATPQIKQFFREILKTKEPTTVALPEATGTRVFAYAALSAGITDSGRLELLCRRISRMNHWEFAPIRRTIPAVRKLAIKGFRVMLCGGSTDKKLTAELLEMFRAM